MTTAAERLAAALHSAGSQYYRLVVLAGLPGSGKTALMQAAAKVHSVDLVNVNLELSRRMLELTRVQRTRQVERLFKELLGELQGQVVFLDNIEILFDPTLELEPLRLLLVGSRHRTVVASWNGTYSDGTLTYAEPGHPEFTQFKKPEAVVVATGADAVT